MIKPTRRFGGICPLTAVVEDGARTGTKVWYFSVAPGLIGENCVWARTLTLNVTPLSAMHGWEILYRSFARGTEDFVFCAPYMVHYISFPEQPSIDTQPSGKLLCGPDHRCKFDRCSDVICA